MQLVIHSNDEAPIYRQILRQIRAHIAGGRLADGSRLPSHRDLAKELGVAPLTVKKAYEELERLSLIETRRGRGTYVVGKLPDGHLQSQREELKAAARRLLAQASVAGFTLDDVLEALSEVEREEHSTSR